MGGGDAGAIWFLDKPVPLDQFWLTQCNHGYIIILLDGTWFLRVSKGNFDHFKAFDHIATSVISSILLTISSTSTMHLNNHFKCNNPDLMYIYVFLPLWVSGNTFSDEGHFHQHWCTFCVIFLAPLFHVTSLQLLTFHTSLLHTTICNMYIFCILETPPCLAAKIRERPRRKSGGFASFPLCNRGKGWWVRTWFACKKAVLASTIIKRYVLKLIVNS